VFENTVLRRLRGPEREVVAGNWTAPHNEKIHNFYASPNTIRVIKLRRMIRAKYAASTKAMRNAYNNLVRKREEKRPWEKLGIEVKIIL
jgi:hypothetical protein